MTEGEIAVLTTGFAGRNTDFLIARPQKFESYLHNFPFRCDTIFVQRKHSAYLCKKI